MKKAIYTLPIALIGVVFLFQAYQKTTSIEKKTETKAQEKWIGTHFKSLNQEGFLYQIEKAQKSIVLLKNEGNLLPLNDLMESTAYLHLGGNSDEFVKTISLFDSGEVYQWGPDIDKNQIATLKANRLVVTLHANHPDSLLINLNFINTLKRLPKAQEKILLVFGTWPESLNAHLDQFNVIVHAPENHVLIQNRSAQMLMGAIPFEGQNTNNIGPFKANSGLTTQTNGRLRFVNPEEVNIPSKALEQIDDIAKYGITSGAYPGCQIAVAVKGAIIYRKSFGKATYDKDSKSIDNEDLYDMASVTKIAASTLMTMQLNYQGKLKLDEKLSKYIPNITGDSEYKNIVIREMMAHQAGLEAFIAFYKNTMGNNGLPKDRYYAKNRSDVFPYHVAEDMFMRKDYKDSMYARILKNPLKEKKFVYSDLCYYFMQPILEKLTGTTQDDYVRKQIYDLMGLRNINYSPLKWYKRSRIIPTEKENYFRNQLIWGHVHDPGAAMLGGVGGHAGLFSNATDLASIMQLYLNNGRYAGQQFFDQNTRENFTKAQFSGNKRGIGFDRPNLSGGGTCDDLASQSSFGHSGFTGTLAWADPKDEVVFIFLSNRVHPSQENWKIRDLNIRTKIQHVVYQAINASK